MFSKYFRAIVALVVATTTLISVVTPASAGSAGPTVSGVPTKASNYEVASGAFTVTLSPTLGLSSFFAEPGKLLVGADFPQGSIDASGGAIERFNPANQYVLRGRQDEANVPEGGFAMFSLGGGVIEFEGMKPTITLPFAWGVNYLVVVRGNYADEDQDTDLNVTATVSKFKSGHALYMRYSGEPNGGFVSEGQLLQTIKTSHTKGTNCGSRGCSTVYVVALDLNTGAWTVVKHGKNFTLVGSNMN